MLVQLLISLFGIASVHRNLSLLEKTEAFSSSSSSSSSSSELKLKLSLLFYVLQLPFYLHLFFKELFVFVLIYIGIFLTTLILFDKIIEYFKEKSFEELHLYIIERIILLLKAGKSAQTSTKNVFDDLTSWQKTIFLELHEFFVVKTIRAYEKPTRRVSQSYYFYELKTILGSTNNVIEQLKSYQKALRLQNNLRHRSRQALSQTKAQALVSFLIYVSFVVLSNSYLKLELLSLTMLVSLILFCTGQILIFRLGGRIKWKT